MSIRAHRVIRKELADSSFNLWHDTDIVDFLETGSHFFEGRNSDGIGMIEVPLMRLKELLANYKWEAQDYRKDAIEADVAWAEENDREFVEYDCF